MRNSNKCDGLFTFAYLVLLVSCSCCVLPGCANPNARAAQTDASYKPKDKSNWYPASISMPEGLQYPCALTALPPSLTGVPENERSYVNHVYSMVLQCVQAKQMMLRDLGSASTARNGYAKYYAKVQPALEKIKKEPTPKGLERFRDDVISAVTLQATFFDKGAKMIEAKSSWTEVMSQPEGRQASGLLMDAWGQMEARYPQWASDTKDSIYHHLCALDLF